MALVTSKTKAEHDKKHMEQKSGKSEMHPHEVHVRSYTEPDDGKIHEETHKHINSVVKKHDAKFKSFTDKGGIFGFEQKPHAESFRQDINVNKYVNAEHLEDGKSYESN